MKSFKMRYVLIVMFALIINGACSKDDTNNDNMDNPNLESLYFPPINSDNWETTEVASLGWDTNALQDLFDFLESKNTRAFIILKDGKIVIEEYWGNNILNTNSFDKNTNWYWASAGKTLTATLVGIAQEEGLLNINDKTSEYLGQDWTALSSEKENLITIKNQLTMTTGLDYQVSDLYCTLPSCLTYKSDAGTQWFYHNAPYTLLRGVVSNATQMDYNQYTDEKIESKTGMNGEWILTNGNNVYWSTPRDMARFGLLMLNEGQWDNTPVLSDTNYYNDMITTSQNLNPAYGYLWWLNGKSSIIFPTLDYSFNMALASNAPNDLVAGIGKNGQFVEVIPNKNLVVIRMGEAPENAELPIEFHNQMWHKINVVIDE